MITNICIFAGKMLLDPNFTKIVSQGQGQNGAWNLLSTKMSIYVGKNKNKENDYGTSIINLTTINGNVVDRVMTYQQHLLNTGNPKPTAEAVIQCKYKGDEQEVFLVDRNTRQPGKLIKMSTPKFEIISIDFVERLPQQGDFNQPAQGYNQAPQGYAPQGYNQAPQGYNQAPQGYAPQAPQGYNQNGVPQVPQNPPANQGYAPQAPQMPQGYNQTPQMGQTPQTPQTPLAGVTGGATSPAFNGMAGEFFDGLGDLDNVDVTNMEV